MRRAIKIPEWADQVPFKWIEDLDEDSLYKRTTTWAKIVRDYRANGLEEAGVVLPQRVRIDVKGEERFTSKSLILITLKIHEGCFVTIEAVSDLIKHYLNGEVSGTAQIRHLASQDGFNILITGDRIPGTNFRVPRGWHMLVNTTSSKPGWSSKKRKASAFQAMSFDEKKTASGYTCLTCGSKEGEPNRLAPHKITKLVEGHADPHAAATSENSFPQCTICNSHRNDYEYDPMNGQVVAVGSYAPVKRSSASVKRMISLELVEELDPDDLVELVSCAQRRMSAVCDAATSESPHQ